MLQHVDGVHRWKRALERLVSLVGVLSVAVFGGSCKRLAQFEPPLRAHRIPERAANFCGRLGWATCTVWEYTDQQRFIDTLGRYGPVAFIVPSPNLDVTQAAFDAAAASAAGALVAGIFIDAGDGTPLPSTYTDLGLTPGNNCIWVRRVGGALRGIVVAEAPPPASPCPAAPATGPLVVRAVPTPAVLPPDATVIGNVPPVARFHEGRRVTPPVHVTGLPHFGLRCGGAWCMFLPPGLDSLPLPHLGSVPPSPAEQRPWVVHGWHDVQHLALRTSAGLMRSSIRASIVPHPRLGTFTISGNFDRGWVHVATIVIHDPIPTGSSYDVKWGFIRGRNELYLRTAQTPTGWTGEIRNVARRQAVQVLRHDHNRFVPGTTRFWWYEDDEGGWVRCEDGCCQVGRR